MKEYQAKFTDVCRVYQPKTIAKKSLSSSGKYPVYGANGQIGFHNEYNHSESELLLGCRGSVGSVHISEPFSWINGNAMVVKPDESVVLKDFVKYALLGGIKLSDAISGTAQPQITRESLSKISIPIYSLEKQKEIIEKLDKSFVDISSLNKNAEKQLKGLELLAQSVLDAEYNELELVSQMVTLQDLCEKIQDGSHFSPKKQSSKPIEGWYPYLTSKNIRNNYIDLKGLTYVPREFHESIYQRCNPEYGDLLLTKDGANTGNVTINTLNEPFSLLSSVCLLKVRKELANENFLKYYLQSSKGNSAILGDMTGTAIKRVILKTIKTIRVPFVELSKQNEVVNRIEENLRLIQVSKDLMLKKIDLCAWLRQSLLKSYFGSDEVANAS